MSNNISVKGSSSCSQILRKGRRIDDRKSEEPSEKKNKFKLEFPVFDLDKSWAEIVQEEEDLQAQGKSDYEAKAEIVESAILDECQVGLLLQKTGQIQETIPREKRDRKNRNPKRIRTTDVSSEISKDACERSELNSSHTSRRKYSKRDMSLSRHLIGNVSKSIHLDEARDLKNSRRGNETRKIKSRVFAKNETGMSYSQWKRSTASSDCLETELPSSSLQRSISSTSNSSRCDDSEEVQIGSETMYFRKGWSEPTLGWCNDSKTLAKRLKELTKAKDKPVYMKYIAEVPKHKREKTNPRTPNRFINFSRRSWDAQVRAWKKSLYAFYGMETFSSSSSCSSSCFSESEDSITVNDGQADQIDYSISDIKQVDFSQNPDAVASLLGHFDLESRTLSHLENIDDESTLKALEYGKQTPKDFSGQD